MIDRPSDMRRLMALNEATLTMDRPKDVDHDDGGFPPPRGPRGEGGGPKGGTYWMRNASMLAITGNVNEIVNRSGYVVIRNPEAYGLSAEAIGAVVNQYDSTREEYANFLAGKYPDERQSAAVWKCSKLVFTMMLQAGWLWVRYDPPSDARFIVTPDAAKRQISAAAEKLSLVQISKIAVTLATDFKDLNDRHPHFSENKTLFFGHDDYQGFLGTFGAVMDWTRGKEAPLSNYLYTIGSLSQRDHVPSALSARKVNVRTPAGYRKRFAVLLTQNQPTRAPEGAAIMRVPSSVGRVNGRDMAPPNTKGTVVVYDDRWFNVQPNQIEVLQDGKWVDYARAKKSNIYGTGED